jgi:pimeloyl-ACP methyl ester carboxylesterase
MEFIDVDGVATRCITAGPEHGFPVVLLHGQSLTADIWARTADALGRHFRVVAPDMLGHGFTAPTGGPPEVPAKLAHLRRLCDRLGFDQLAIGGSSYGALVATRFFLGNRDRVRKLVINGSGSCFNTDAQLAAQLTKMHALYKPRLDQPSPDNWRELLSHSFHDAGKILPELPHLLALCYAQPWARECWDVSIAEMRDPARFGRFRILHELEKITVDTLVVWGREDRGGVYASAVDAVARMPAAKLVTFEQCGHYAMIEHPQAYSGLVTDFLKS